MRGIAAKGAVTPEDFGLETSLTRDQAHSQFESLSTFGLEMDDAGRIFGAALTTSPTSHAVSLGDKQLFAWCALDTLFIPGLSTCPVSNTAVRLTVTPDGVQSVDPPEAVLSVVVLGVDAAGGSIGLASPT